MRALPVVLLLLAGCPSESSDCKVDSDCNSSHVCARNGECLAASNVRTIHVTWTIRGQAADATTCARTPNFYVLFASFDPGDTYGYEPVPCAEGRFTIDKLPTRYTSVEIGVDGGFSDQTAFDAQGTAAFNLMP